MSKVKALVLTGGGAKGAFQAGVIYSVLKKGFVPDIIYGVSVGSLNGLFLADRFSRYKDYNGCQAGMVGLELMEFWKKNITKSSSIGKKRNIFSLAYKVLFSKFDSIIDTSNLDKLMHREIDINNVATSPVRLSVGYVDIDTGKFITSTNEDPKIIDYSLASTRMPIIMPLKTIDGRSYTDGGIRNIAPLKEAIDDGADEIVVIACQAMDAKLEPINKGNLFSLANRVIGIMTSEIIHNDLIDLEVKKINQINLEVASGANTRHKEVKISIVRPIKPIQIELPDLTSEDVHDMIDFGVEMGDLQYNPS